MRRLVPIFALFLTVAAHAEINPEWTAPVSPFQIADNLYYVGSQELAAYLVTTSAGNILINANLEMSPPQIRASVEKLGFHWADTKILLNSQAHFDHMAGAAQILRETSAKNMVMTATPMSWKAGAGRTSSRLSALCQRIRRRKSTAFCTMAIGLNSAGSRWWRTRPRATPAAARRGRCRFISPENRPIVYATRSSWAALCSGRTSA
jgi:hypothetical protein